MVWLAIQANEGDIRAALLRAGIEIIESGGWEDLSSFLARASSLKGNWGFVVLQGLSFADIVNPQDPAFVQLFRKGPAPPGLDEPATAELAAEVEQAAQQKGACVLDLGAHEITASDAMAIAAKGGLKVSFTIAAIFSPGDEWVT